MINTINKGITENTEFLSQDYLDTFSIEERLKTFATSILEAQNKELSKLEKATDNPIAKLPLAEIQFRNNEVIKQINDPTA